MAELLRLWGSAMAEPHSRAPQLGGLGARPCVVVSPFWARILWFSGLFSKHRSPINVILDRLRSCHRYEHNGSCFVGFRGRLTLQTHRNVRECRRNGLSGTLQGVPCPWGSSAIGWPSSCVCGTRLWPSPIAELPSWGARGSAMRRRFALLGAHPLVFGAFLEAAKFYRCDS